MVERKRNINRNGKIYSTFTWPVAITAAMAGTKEIGFEVNLRVRVNSRRNSPFSSPFFNDPFFGFGREESLTVNLPNKAIEIKPLPTSNRPPEFSGAIGNFTATSSIDTDQIEVGDPVRFTFSLEGKGNFAAIPAPSLESNEVFKVGPPAFFYEGNEETKFEGKQNFEYIITPLKAGKLSLPSINFSYFDPSLEKYSTVVEKSMEIRVNPGKNGSNLKGILLQNQRTQWEIIIFSQKPIYFRLQVTQEIGLIHLKQKIWKINRGFGSFKYYPYQVLFRLFSSG